MVSVIRVIKRARSQQNKLVDTLPEKTVDETEKPALSTLEKFLISKKTDAYSERIRPTIGTPGSSFSFDKNGPLVRLPPIYGAVQKVVRYLMHPAILNLTYHSTLAGDPGERRLGDRLNCDYV